MKQNTLFRKALSTVSALAAASCMSMSAQSNAALQIEAEDADYDGAVVVEDASLSGGKGVNVTDADYEKNEFGYIKFKFNVSESGMYKVIIRGADLYGEKHAAIGVDGTTIDVTIDSKEEIVAGSFMFSKGENIVTAAPGWGWFVIDYARIELDEEAQAFAEKSITPSVDPINSNASASAKKLYSFLYDNFGSKTISGFMLGNMDTGASGLDNHEDFKVVYEKSGKYPALVGIDMMNATGQAADGQDPYYKTYTDISINLAKEIWTRGGIPAITWHWRDPSRQTNEFYTWSEDHPNGMKINYAELAFTSNGEWDKNSSYYKNMIKDIDLIADYMLELQEAGVAAIFRPLHEASGGWFWWGKGTGEQYAKLYRLVYDEMVNVKGVNNLIWVWNPQSVNDVDWNPGAEYFDVISIDIYKEAFNHSSNYVSYLKLKEISDCKKIIALSENGPIPNPENCFEEYSPWSWWMPWYQSWGGKYADQTSNENWKKFMASDLIITLDEMPGWDNVTSVAESASSSIKVYPSVVGDRLHIEAATAFVTTIYDANGRAVFAADNASDIDTSAWTAGIYLVAVQTATEKAIVRVVK